MFSTRHTVPAVGGLDCVHGVSVQGGKEGEEHVADLGGDQSHLGCAVFDAS
jgi:hypothetical protein